MSKFLISLFVVLLISYLFGWLSQKMGQPKVVGEMIGGIMIGPSFLGKFFPEFLAWLFPQNVQDLLYHFSQLGLSLYMLLIGMHIGKEKIKNTLINSGVKLAAIGIAPTFFAIYCFSWTIYPSLEKTISSQIVYSFFMAASISVTAFPVLVRILDQNGMIETKMGKLVVLSASIDDAFAWILLPIIISLGNLSFSSFTIIIHMLIYLCGMFFICKPILRFITNKLASHSVELFSIIIITFLLSSLIAEKIGLHCIFGGFIAGLIIPRIDMVQKNIQKNLSNFVNILLVPIYFVISGLNIDLYGFSNNYSFFTIVLFIILAFLSKYLSCAFFAKLMGYSWGESSAIGALMNARGLMILIFAQVGLSNKIISQDDYCILFLIALFTTVITTPLFKWSLVKREKNINPINKLSSDKI